MIPHAYIQAWSGEAPWPDQRQVEQDLIICRALCDLFSAAELRDKIAFRGRRRDSQAAFQATATVFRRHRSRANATEARALLQRNKGRDLFDLHHGLEQLVLDADALIACFDHYLALESHPISRAVAERRMLQKLTRSLTEDIAPLLPSGIVFTAVHAIDAFNRVWTQLISRIKSDAWKSSANAISELRAKKHPEVIALTFRRIRRIWISSAAERYTDNAVKFVDQVRVMQP